MGLAPRRIIIAAALAAGVQSGSAQESFFNDRFYARGGGPESDAFPDCSFHTREQCIVVRAERRPLVHHESMVARTSAAAEGTRQEPSAP
jgi:hypothetical protein